MRDGEVSEKRNLEFEAFLRTVPKRWEGLPLSNDPIVIAALLMLTTQTELFSAFNVSPGRLVARCILLRSMMEVLADISHIMRAQNKKLMRAKAYTDSAIQLRESLVKSILDMRAGSSGAKMAKLTNWTTSSIEDRLRIITPSMAHMYDVLSYCTHSHPGKVWLFGDGPNEGPINEPFLRRMALGQMVSVAARCGDLGALNDMEKSLVEDMRLYIDQTIV